MGLTCRQFLPPGWKGVTQRRRFRKVCTGPSAQFELIQGGPREIPARERNHLFPFVDFLNTGPHCYKVQAE